MEHAEERIRLFNVRYVPLFAAFLILGIFCVKVSIVIAAILWGVAILCALTLLFTKHIKWGAALALVAFLFVGYGIASLELHLRNDVGLEGLCEVSCRVTEITEEEDAYLVTADRVSANGRSYSGGISFRTDVELHVGDRVAIYGEIGIDKLSLESFMSALNYRKGSKYTSSYPEIRRVKSGAAPLAERIKKGAKDILVKAQGDRYGGFTYATIFGDSTEMLREDKQAMQAVGVAHVFAISGLHVSVLAGVLLFLLRKLKIKDGVAILILLPIFGFYAYLVGFSPSVLRASIMVLTALAASHFGERYDDFSALGFAAILLLLTRPLLLFDLSFVMSFLSIFGIHSLVGPLKATFVRHKVKERLASALALSIASTLALLPVSAVVFGRISLVGFLLNIVVVPLASISYVLCLVGLIFSAILPSFGAVLTAVAYLPRLIIALSTATASLQLSAKYEFSAAEILVYYATLAFVGKYSLAAKKVKLVAGGIGAGVLAILIFAI